MREWLQPRLRGIRLAGSAVLAVLIGYSASGWRDDFLLFMNARAFGVVDPIFGNDVGYYVFRVGFLSHLLSWSFNLVATVTVLVAAAHYINGGIRWRPNSFPGFSPSAKSHISILLAVMALIRAGLYRIDAYQLLYTERSESFFGPGYADVNARLPALRLLLLVAVLAAIVFVVNIWRQGWTLPAVSLAAWLVVSLGAGVVYPAVVERFQVQPSPLLRQEAFITYNIDATRAAYGLDQVEVRQFAVGSRLEPESIEANRATLNNLRLWDPSVLSDTYASQQEIRTYYALERADTDRYLLDGEIKQVMVAVRELDEQNLPSDDWQAVRLNYTHGIGAVVSSATDVAADGTPSYLVHGVPAEVTTPELASTQDRIYFGETHSPTNPVVVRTNAKEFDFPTGGDVPELNEYDGLDGVELSSVWRRLAMAVRFRDLNLAISGYVRRDSRVLMERNIRARVDEIVPFLAQDSDPYPVLIDGRILWVIDLYTTSNRYPYSVPADRPLLQRVARLSGLGLGFNYIRNSVKATVDAYDGNVNLYVVDDTDPIIATWQAVYPGLFRAGGEMPATLSDHLRYPQDLFKVQSEVYLNYHMTDSAEFFRREDAWSVPVDPSTPRRLDLLVGDIGEIGTQGGVSYLDKVLPYYLLMRLPGDEDSARLAYVLVQPLDPEDKPNLASFLLAEYVTGDDNGRLIDYQIPSGSAVPDPKQVGNRIEGDDEIAGQFSLWRGKGSAVLLGDMLVVPVDDSLLYVQPVYLSTEQGELPKFQRVIVVHGDDVVWDQTLDLALDALFGPASTTQPETDVKTLLEQASGRFNQAEDALRAGNLAGYQQLLEEARSLLDQALAVLSET
jgi:uncharacterized membrane protein (UPF0182 family)